MTNATSRKVRKPEEPKVACPVCRAETKESEMIPEAMAGARMCYRCAHYLAPEKGGTDHGAFMVRIETRDDGLRRAFIRPRGFWSDAVEVHETEDYWASHEAGKKVIKHEVRWGTGGCDGTHDEIRVGHFDSYAENFARAMDHAVMLAKIWKMERQ